MNKIQCPACDSYNVTICEKQGIAQAVYGTEVPYNEKVIKCNDCESSFVDNTIAVDPYSKALEQSKKESVTCILDSLSQLGTNLAAMERALELPQRTLSRWKSGADPSAAGLTLLRFINTYPWLLEVADVKYDSIKAGDILIMNALAKMHDNISQKGCQIQEVQGRETSSGFSLHIDFTDNEGTIRNIPFLENGGNLTTVKQAIGF